MKNVVDLFIAKDRTAIFWFTVACASILCSAIYVQRVIKAVQTKPQYVIMDGNGVYYLAPSVEFEKATELHVAQTRLAMETLYVRNPQTLVFKNRVSRLFFADGVKMVDNEFRAEAERFADEQITQTLDIYEAPTIYKIDGSRGQAITHAKGKLTRNSTFKGQKKTEVLYVDNYFYWKMNARMSENSWFPTVCFKMQLSEPAKQPQTKGS